MDANFMYQKLFVQNLKPNPMETQEKVNPGKKIKGTDVKRITPFLWFNNQAEEAVHFYTLAFKNSAIGAMTRYGKAESEAI